MALLLLAIVLALTSPASALEDAEERLGPFRIDGQDFTVVLYLKRLPGTRGDENAALTALEIHDRSGSIQYRETFSYSVDAGAFLDSCMASAQLLRGGFASGLLISIGCLPSAPNSGDVWELFGLQNGKLILFLPDVMRFRVWTSNFRVTVPVRVDWMQGRLMLGQRCFEQTGQGLREGGCEVPVEAERVPGDQELTFVRLFPEASEGTVPRHIVLRKDSSVEILAAKTRLSWDESRDVIFFGVDDQDPWLKVRIDGAEGWIHTQEDFNAIGVPQAG